MNEVAIVLASAGDAEDLENVRYAAWLSTYPNDAHSVTVEDIAIRFQYRYSAKEMRSRRSRLESPRPGEKWLVAKIGNRVVGFCLVINNDEKNELSALFVHPEFHRQGIGTALWEEGRKHLDQKRDTEVWTPVYNWKAIRFYRRHGFKGTGHTKRDPWLTMRNGSIIPELQLIKKG